MSVGFRTNYEDTRRKVKNDGSSNTSYLELETEDTDSVEAHMLYLWIYVGFVLAALSSVLVVTISYFGYTMRIGVNIHDRMFKRLSRAPTKFFDTNPPGKDAGNLEGSSSFLKEIFMTSGLRANIEQSYTRFGSN